MGIDGAITASDASGDEVVDLAERTWLARHCDGDPTAFPALMQAFQRPVYTYLSRCGVHPDTRDDVFQEIFIKVHRAARTYRASRPLGPWLFAIAANTVRNHFRDSSPQQRSVELSDDLPGHDAPARQAEARQHIARVEREIRALPLSQREVLVLSTFHDMRLSDIATALALPLNTVKTRLRRARLQLAARLAEPSRSEPGGSHDQL